MHKGDQLLSYGCVNILQEDLNLLEKGQWLNDKLLSFAAEWLMNGFESKSDAVYIFAPPECELIKTLGDPVNVNNCFEALNLKQKEIVMFMLNDNMDASRVCGGSHWTLLVFQRSTDAFLHLNSSPTAGCNSYWAQKIVENCGMLLGTSSRQLRETTCPTQKNGTDCGLFVIEFAKCVMKDGDVSNVTKLSSSDISKQRSHWKELIQSMVKGTTHHI